MSLVTPLFKSLAGLAPEDEWKSDEYLSVDKPGWVSFRFKEGKLLQNVMIPGGGSNGAPCEVDIIYITVKGVYIIQSENYIGHIYGNESIEEWSLKQDNGRNYWGLTKLDKHTFKNPIRENMACVRALKDLFKQDVQTISLLVFPDVSDLKSIDYDQKDIKLINKKDLHQTLLSTWKEYPEVIDLVKIAELDKKLRPLADADDEMKKLLAGNPVSRKDITVCPYCGGKIVLRTAKSGEYKGKQYYGCVNFPKCSYIRNIIKDE